MNEMVESSEHSQKESEEKYRQLELHSLEIYHRVKNNMNIISSLLELQSKYIKEKQYLEMLRDSQDRIKCMSIITDIFYQSKDLEKIEVNNHLKYLANDLIHSHGVADKIELILNIETISLKIEHVTPFMLIINELITNSLRHAFPGDTKGEIKISLCAKDENMIELQISDNSAGIPYDVNFRKNDSLGLHILTGLAEQLNGKVELDRSRGTDFKIIFNRGKE